MIKLRFILYFESISDPSSDIKKINQSMNESINQGNAVYAQRVKVDQARRAPATEKRTL